MISFETSVRIGRPNEEVFAFVSNPLLFPRWNSAVAAVHGNSAQPGRVGSTYSMQRELPTGRVENGLEVFACESSHQVRPPHNARANAVCLSVPIRP